MASRLRRQSVKELLHHDGISWLSESNRCRRAVTKDQRSRFRPLGSKRWDVQWTNLFHAERLYGVRTMASRPSHCLTHWKAHDKRCSNNSFAPGSFSAPL